MIKEKVQYETEDGYEIQYLAQSGPYVGRLDNDRESPPDCRLYAAEVLLKNYDKIESFFTFKGVLV